MRSSNKGLDTLFGFEFKEFKLDLDFKKMSCKHLCAGEARLRVYKPLPLAAATDRAFYERITLSSSAF